MAPRFDPERSQVELSVADLLDTRLLRHLGFANRGGYERMWLGQAIHGRYQAKAFEEDPTYRREVHLSVSFVHRGWQVTIADRHGDIAGGASGNRRATAAVAAGMVRSGGASEDAFAEMEAARA